MGSIRLGSAFVLAVAATFATAAAVAAASVDRVAPETAITSAPPAKIVVKGSQTATATWEFTANEYAGFTCKFTHHQVEPCTSPMTYAGLSRGRYTFTVYAFDASGNRDMTRARSKVRVVKKKKHH